MSGVVGDDLAELVANMMTHHLRHVGQIADPDGVSEETV